MYLEHSFIALLAFLSFTISWTRNVFMSLMYSILLYINSFVVLLSLGFEFLAIINVLVYVGALAVLFLFVIMLLEIPSTELRAYYRGYSALIIPFFGIYYYARSFWLSNSTILTFIPTLESINSVGYAFYIVYADVLVLNSLILTIALFGALVLAHSQSN
uniref:NADH-ubiquinone oxidoreductase chain 6 n=1 Tax=Dunaliella salina TaxID=3046 RepID=A0A1C9FRY0_DUNSA|nr:NADH dehydrogenase subunit 6 [Dunaliella salina]